MFTNSKQPWHALMPPRCDTYRFLLRFLREVSSPSSQLHSGSAPLSWGGTEKQRLHHCAGACPWWHFKCHQPALPVSPMIPTAQSHGIHRAPSPPPQLPQWEKLLSPPAWEPAWPVPPPVQGVPGASQEMPWPVARVPSWFNTLTVVLPMGGTLTSPDLLSQVGRGTPPAHRAPCAPRTRMGTQNQSGVLQQHRGRKSHRIIESQDSWC